jgi:hypothetical protein
LIWRGQLEKVGGSGEDKMCDYVLGSEEK